jgi:serine/threonine protein phosphatase PrpC
MTLYGGTKRGHAGGDVGLQFGSCNIPVPGKDHDRQAFLRLGGTPLGAKAPLEPLQCFAFGLFDGHGINAGVSELAACSLLPAVSDALLAAGDASSSSTAPTSSSSVAVDAVDVAVEDKGELRASKSLDTLIDDAAGGKDRRQRCLLAGFQHVSQLIATQFDAQRVGSTATVLLVSRPAASLPAAGWDVTCAWVGDSRAVVVGPGGFFAHALSDDHRLELPREWDRVMAVQKAEAATSPTGQRATVVAHRVCNATGRQGPRVMFNEKTGVSTMVTRSFGDSLGATALIDEPELCHVTAAAGSRLVVCSDGVWDVLSHERVAALIKRVANPRAAAKVLCDAAKKARLYGGHSADDISAIVINLDAETSRSKK